MLRTIYSSIDSCNSQIDLNYPIKYSESEIVLTTRNLHDRVPVKRY